MSTDHPAHGGPRSGRRRSHGWVVTLDAAGSACDVDLADRALDFGELLQPYGGAVLLEHDQPRYRATFSIGEPELDASAALFAACHIFRDLAARAELPTWPIVHAEITQVVDHADLHVVH